MVKLTKNQNLNEKLPCLKCISATESIDSEGHQEDVVSRKKEKTDRKNERISAGWTGEEMVKVSQEDRMKDQHSRRYALFFQEHGSC